MLAAAAAGTTQGAEVTGDLSVAVRDIERSMAVIDASWDKTIRGTDSNLYMADTYNTQTGAVSGPSDIWPLTAAVEAHCSLLEALEMVKEAEPSLYEDNVETYRHRLDLLIDNLEYYRGSYGLASYAHSANWSPYAVPRASQRGEANVTGILNVYDDQMWLSRELIRAYRVTGNEDYLDLATYLADYVIDGWDCWRDDNGKEYGGITWGPGYNSKHACSNAPIIQPLVWLHDIYDGSEATMDYYYRDENNAVKHEVRLRSELYLEFAGKVYDWQRENLLNSSNLYLDMKGADNTIKVVRGYRQHVDCGGATGTVFSYNTGTMIAGGAELYRVTGDERYKSELSATSRASFSEFAGYVRSKGTYLFNTDQSATSGFNTWFNNVLMRSYVDAIPYVDNTSAASGLEAFQKTLDYAYENYNRDGLLPIRFLDGWGTDVVTKGFHQFTFAAQYAMLAVHNLKALETGGVDAVVTDSSRTVADDMVYNLSGIAVGHLSDVKATLPAGLYIVGGRKVRMGN